jgi:hypothetical protein
VSTNTIFGLLGGGATVVVGTVDPGAVEPGTEELEGVERGVLACPQDTNPSIATLTTTRKRRDVTTELPRSGGHSLTVVIEARKVRILNDPSRLGPCSRGYCSSNGED